MITALDTNIVFELLTNRPQAKNVRSALEECQGQGSLILCAAVYAELLAYPRITEIFLDDFLHATGIRIVWNVGQPDWTLAGIRYGQYAERRRKATREQPRRLLADFLIGAHALASATRLLTLDTAFYRRAYPELRLYPEPSA